jgi:hypothetical protein
LTLIYNGIVWYPEEDKEDEGFFEKGGAIDIAGPALGDGWGADITGTVPARK